jgi:FlaA1/EpsC-like NDP-sugar epimerase
MLMLAKSKRSLLLVLIDIFIINIAFFLAFLIRFDFDIPVQYIILYKQSFIVFTLSNIFTFIFFKQYHKIWRYVNLKDLIDLMVVINNRKCCIIAYIIFIADTFAKVYLPIKLAFKYYVGYFKQDVL